MKKCYIDENIFQDLFSCMECEDIAYEILRATVEDLNDGESYFTDSSEVLDDNLYNKLIYNCDKWSVLQSYIMPEDCDKGGAYQEALNAFWSDLAQCIKEA